jgi:hypothetical protein
LTNGNLKNGAPLSAFFSQTIQETAIEILPDRPANKHPTY